MRACWRTGSWNRCSASPTSWTAKTRSPIWQFSSVKTTSFTSRRWHAWRACRIWSDSWASEDHFKRFFLGFYATLWQKNDLSFPGQARTTLNVFSRFLRYTVAEEWFLFPRASEDHFKRFFSRFLRYIVTEEWFLFPRVHIVGSLQRKKIHPEARAVMFDDVVYSKRKIKDFLATIRAFSGIIELVRRIGKSFANSR